MAGRKNDRNREAAGKLIASNPESKQAFQNGNVAKRLQMIVQAMWQKK